MSKTRKTRQAVSQLQLLEIARKLEADKIKVQARINNGTTATALSHELGIPVTTVRTLLTSIGIEHGRSRERNDQSLAEVTARTVQKIARELNIATPELDILLATPSGLNGNS